MPRFASMEFSDHKVSFQIVFEDEWQHVLNAILLAD
jgi:hypothetical protein